MLFVIVSLAILDYFYYCLGFKTRLLSLLYTNFSLRSAYEVKNWFQLTKKMQIFRRQQKTMDKLNSKTPQKFN